MKKNTDIYFMDDEREASRLARKVDAGKWVEKYFSTFIENGMNVLDVGCGPGVIAAEISSKFSEVEVKGVDISESRLEYARKNAQGINNIHFSHGSALSLPFQDSQFDFVYSRLLMEYLPAPNDAVREMVRVCRPGGRVLLQDLDGQLLWHYPIEKELDQRIDRIITFLKKTGFDPFVGQKLFYLIQSNGLKEIEVKVEPYHLYAGKIGRKDFELWKLKLKIAEPQIALALGSEKAARQFITDYIANLESEDTLTYSNLFTVTGVVS